MSSFFNRNCDVYKYNYFVQGTAANLIFNLDITSETTITDTYNYDISIKGIEYYGLQIDCGFLEQDAAYINEIVYMTVNIPDV